MKYEGVCIAVEDVERSKRFYQELFELEVFQDYGINVSFGGLSLQQEFDWLVQLPKEQIVQRPNNAELCFEETDFDAFLEKLQAYPDLTVLGGVREHSWGQRVIRFYDPDGHIIEVGENMAMVVRRFLATGMTMEEVSARMDVSVEDLNKLLQD